MHGGLVGDDLALVIVAVPAGARRALEVADVGREGDGCLAEEALDVALAPEEGRHKEVRSGDSSDAPGGCLALAQAPNKSLPRARDANMN